MGEEMKISLRMQNFDFNRIEYMAKRFNPWPTRDDFLDERYYKQAQSQEWPYYRFFYHLSKMLKPHLVVELGGFQGTAAAHFSAGAAQVITIDHHTDPGDEYNEDYMFEVCEKYTNVYYLHGWTNAQLTVSQHGKHALGNAPNAFPFVESVGGIDILFIDSWHTYEYAKLDYETYLPLMNSPGLIICDDIAEGEMKNKSEILGMLKFWDELPGDKFLNNNLHPTSGMGFLLV